MPFPTFDRTRLAIKPLAERQHLVTLSDLIVPGQISGEFPQEKVAPVARAVVDAARGGHQVLLMMGAHVIKAGLSRVVIDLMERGVVTHVGMNGAGTIHDFELALIGATSESVAHYIREGQFGLWQETGRINDAVVQGARDGLGMGEAIGRMIEQERLPHREVSIVAAGFRLRVPITVHVGIGYDIIHEHPNCDGAALGATSYQDFLTIAHTVSQFEGGVLLNFGTAVMGPEVFLKALSMARNVARQEGRAIRRFTTAVFDLLDLGEELDEEAPKTDPRYYFRPYKTLLVRTVRDGGQSFYIRGEHRLTLPALHREVVRLLSQEGAHS
ncbi:MAG: hypothetical protein ONB30_07440 [candidate division KSB1 bacterium]|nr:hypothetical protein [candidate division KSB1 bacterium]